MSNQDNKVRKVSKGERIWRTFLVVAIILFLCTWINHILSPLFEDVEYHGFQYNGSYFNKTNKGYVKMEVENHEDYYEKYYQKVDTFSYDKYIRELEVGYDDFYYIYNCLDKSILISDKEYESCDIFGEYSYNCVAVNEFLSLGIAKSVSIIKDKKKIIFYDKYKGMDEKFLEYVKNNSESFSYKGNDYFMILNQDMYIKRKIQDIKKNIGIVIEDPFKHFIDGTLDSIVQEKRTMKLESRFFEK